MAAQSPLQRALELAGQAIAGGINQNYQLQQQLATEKQNRANQINALLANPNMPAANREQLQGLLGRIAGAQSMQELNNLPAQYQQEINPGSPAFTGKQALQGIFSSGKLETPSQVVGEATSAGAEAAQQYQQLQASRQTFNSTVLPLLAGNTDPAVKKKLYANFMAKAPAGTLTPEIQAAAESVAGFQDPTEALKAISEAKTAQSGAVSAAAKAQVDQGSVQSLLADLAAKTASDRTNAWVANQTKGQKVQAAALANEQAKVSIASVTQDTLLKKQQWIDQHGLNQANIARIQEATQAAGIQLNEQTQQADMKAVQAAYEAGSDAGLTDPQKAMLAAYIGSTTGSKVQVGDAAYTGFLHGRAQDNFTTFQASMKSAQLDNAAKAAGLKLSAQQLADLKQNFDINAYKWNRDKAVNALADPAATSATIFKAMEAGDTGTVETYINYLNNPDVYPQQAALLKSYGITKDGLAHAYAVANQNYAVDYQTDAQKLQLLEGQVGQLASETWNQKVTTLEGLAKTVKDPATLNTITAGLTASGRWKPDEIAMFKSFAAAGIATTAMGAAATEYSSLASNVPADPADQAKWRTQLESAASRAGMDSNSASSVADGLITAFNQSTDKLDQSLAQGKAQLALIAAQISDTQAHAAYYKTDAGLRQLSAIQGSLSAQSTNLSHMASNNYDQRKAEGCVLSPSITIGQAVGGLTAPSLGIPGPNANAPGCRALAKRGSDISNQMASVNSMLSQAVGMNPQQLTPYKPGPQAGSVATTPPAAGAPAPAPAQPLQVQTGGIFNKRTITVQPNVLGYIKTGYANGGTDAQLLSWLESSQGFSAGDANAILKAYKAQAK